MSDGASARRPGAAPPRAPRAEKRAQQRQRILDSARAVFFRDGFMAANLDEVAERAGVAKGTLYRYFENKAELYVAVLAENGDVFERKMRESIEEGIAPAEQVRRLSRFYFQHWTTHREYFPIFWALANEQVIGELPPAVVTQVSQLWEQCLRLLADVLDRGVRERVFAPHDSWEVAHILWTLANGLIASENAQAARKLRRRRLETVFEDAVELALRGLTVPERARP
ncbi:MAG TPA: TetR/AcrR family transcriptional regulator [Myxococcota bacterium]|jgi:AcrR family transcriptional regulator|nr:TetR/AcrR family transcriptional regulator [Myxococcota bacterium]